MKKENNEPQLTEYEKYCRMMAQQQEDEMDETIMEDELLRDCSPELLSEISHGVKKEYQPEGVFVRGH
ncbi:MAG: hypothetical protein MJZ12_03720 [Prevotella sp.]|nr:hypothetical protein [Prevotella sp.]